MADGPANGTMNKNQRWWGTVNQGLSQAVTENFMAERDRRVLWLPVFLGLGIGVYFSLPFEPPTWIAWAAPAIAVLAIFAVRKRTTLLLLTLALTASIVGFSVAIGRTVAVDAPQLERRIGPTLVASRRCCEPRAGSSTTSGWNASGGARG